MDLAEQCHCADDRTPKMLRIGFWMTDKKIKKLRFNRCIELCRERGIDLVEIKLDEPLESQGPFYAIVHKLIDMIGNAKLGDEQSIHIVHFFMEYFLSHPTVRVLDPLFNVCKLLNRNVQYQMIKEVCSDEAFFIDAISTLHVDIPPFYEFLDTNRSAQFELLEAAGITFPIICKPHLAHGPSQSHEMVLIFDEDFLADAPVPCVVQSFINHDAVLYKIFLIGDNTYVVERPSLKNFRKKKRESISFHSGDISKPNATSDLTTMSGANSTARQQPSFDLLSTLGQKIRQKFGLDMVGIDVIVASEDGRLAIIDINAFPGYDGVPDFHEVFCDYLQSVVTKSPLSSGGTSVCCNNNNDKLLSDSVSLPSAAELDVINELMHIVHKIPSSPPPAAPSGLKCC